MKASTSIYIIVKAFYIKMNIKSSNNKVSLAAQCTHIKLFSSIENITFYIIIPCLVPNLLPIA